jgi:hypothetical protein
MEKEVIFQKLNKKIKENFRDQVSFLQKLVQTKSVNPFTPEASDPNKPIEKGGLFNKR